MDVAGDSARHSLHDVYFASHDLRRVVFRGFIEYLCVPRASRLHRALEHRRCEQHAAGVTVGKHASQCASNMWHMHRSYHLHVSYLHSYDFSSLLLNSVVHACEAALAKAPIKSPAPLVLPVLVA